MAEVKKYFRIQGDAVHLVTERVERTVRLYDLMGEVVKDIGITTPILPAGCKFFSQRGDKSIFVIEQAPTTRLLEWDGKWKLAFPYIIFVVGFRSEAVATDECRIFYRPSPLSGGDDKLLRTNLCNVYQDGRICTGNVRVSGDTLAQKAESFVSVFWRSRFNWDLSGENWGPAASRFPQVSSLERWQEETAKNPLFPLGIKWFEVGRLADIVEGRC